jgi:hypothetical protein
VNFAEKKDDGFVLSKVVGVKERVDALTTEHRTNLLTPHANVAGTVIDANMEIATSGTFEGGVPLLSNNGLRRFHQRAQRMGELFEHLLQRSDINCGVYGNGAEEVTAMARLGLVVGSMKPTVWSTFMSDFVSIRRETSILEKLGAALQQHDPVLSHFTPTVLAAAA